MVRIEINNDISFLANTLLDVRLPGSTRRSIKMVHEINRGDLLIYKGEPILVIDIKEIPNV